MVSYVSIGEWQTFSEMCEINEARAVREFMYFSLHRANSSVTRRFVWWWAVRHRKAHKALIDLICKISIANPPKGKGKVQEPPGIDDREMKTVYRILSKMHGWTPDEISAMSHAQIFSYLSGGKDGTGIEKMSGAEYKSRFLRN